MLVRGCLILGLTLATASATLAQEVTLDSLRCMDRCALDDLFRSGRVVAPPVGYARGHILYFSECYYRCPKLAAAMSGIGLEGESTSPATRRSSTSSPAARL